MIKIENVEVTGWEHAIRGMRNPRNSWEKSDSHCCNCEDCIMIENKHEPAKECDNGELGFCVGENDFELMMKLVNAGTDHRKFMRMITVYMDVTAPMYWWSEADTYKVGTVRNSCSKMHKLLSKPFEMSDFSFDNVTGSTYENVAKPLIDMLNELRNTYFKLTTEEAKKLAWYSIIQLLPSSYNQRATLMLNYEVLANIYHSRKNHKLDEWREFCKWVENLPYSELITGGDGE